MHSLTMLNTPSHTNTYRDAHKDTNNMAFQCIAERPCDSHGVISWEHPPPLISLMDYNNRKSAWPATSHHTTPTDNSSLSHTHYILLQKHLHSCRKTYMHHFPAPLQPCSSFMRYINGSHLSVITVKSKFNPSKSVLCITKELMARCPLLLALVASETRCSHGRNEHHKYE